MNYLTSYRKGLRGTAIVIIALVFCLNLILSVRAQSNKLRTDQKETKVRQLDASQGTSISSADKEPIRQEELLMSIKANALPQYLGSGDPALKDYYPLWLDNMADDATVEGSMLDGAVQGAEAVRSVVLTIRSLYDRQEHKFAGPYSDNGFLEDYVAEVHGEPIGCVVLVTYNAAGQTQHVVASYRPRSSLLLFSRLLGEKFAGTPIAEHFSARES